MPGRTAFAVRLAATRLRPGKPVLIGSRLLALLAALAFTFSCLLSAIPATAQTEETVAVPLLDRLPDGRRIGFWAPVGFGGNAPIPLLLDTGSKGLMVMASRLGNTPVKRTGRRMKQVFLDGTTFEGEIVRTRLTLGRLTTPEPVFVLAVNKATCAKERPDCPARMFGGKGPAGIMGVGLGNVTTLDNPLEYLPPPYGEGFIIQGQGPGGRAYLTLGLTPANRAGFTMFPLPRSKLTASWREAFFAVNALPACLTLEDSGSEPLCGRFLLDSGSSASILSLSPGGKGASRPQFIGPSGLLPGGKRVTVSIEGLPPLSLTSTATPWGDSFRLTQGGKAHNILGAGFFTLLDVLYDIKGGAIGLRPAR